MSRPLPVRLFSFEYPPVGGGISRLAAEAALGLARLGRRVAVLTQAGQAADAPDLPAVRLPAARPGREWLAWLALRRLPPDERLLASIWYPEGLLALLAGRRYVLLAHGLELMDPPSPWRRGLWRRLRRLTLSRADLVIANSAYTRDLVRRMAPAAKAVALPLGVDPGRFSPGSADQRRAARLRFGTEGRRTLLSVSRLQRYKGHETVLAALAALPPEERAQVLYLVAGTGPDQPLFQARAQALGLAGQVRFLGFVAEADLPDLYRAADLFVLCSRESAAAREVEGFGLVFLEAQASGLPVIGTRTGGIPDAVRHERGGWLIDQDDVPALAALFSSFVREPAAFAEAGRQARARVEAECGWDRYAADLDALLAVAEWPSPPAGATADSAVAAASSAAPGVTVVVPTLNRHQVLRDCLDDLLAQDHRPLQILVVDQSAEVPADLLRLAEIRPELDYRRVAHFRGLPEARNHGLAEARHEIIIYVDDDVRLKPDFVTRHVEALRLPGVGMVAGGIDEAHRPVDPGPPTGTFSRLTGVARRGFAARGQFPVEHVPGGNFSAWRSVLQAAGGVDARLNVGAALYEELDLCLRVRRLGWRILFQGEARLTHLAAAGGGCRVEDLGRYLRALCHNRAIVVRRHVSPLAWPVAAGRLVLTCLSYARAYRRPGVLAGCLAGFLEGWRKA